MCLFSCTDRNGQETNNTQTTETNSDSLNYIKAVQDAMVAEADEISKDLISITTDNQYIIWNETKDSVLVVVWTKEKWLDSYKKPGFITTNSWGKMYITVVPEIKDRFKTFSVKNEEITTRVEQLLGLQKGREYTHFVELWVSPNDLFRPAPDKGINDNTAELYFPENPDSIYVRWFADNILKLYYYETKYPWTRLGYTYDWGNQESEIGVSEFVIEQNSKIITKSITTTSEYLK